eukprot:gb/GECG01009042.1/.p1 GENE.gb/GECG01009042.1/~~gb/GECG01009042.1/.p1  ORF type:complete len:614 (+),score=69.61 gb/GECG01009042.1/:1-1842(+)
MQWRRVFSTVARGEPARYSSSGSAPVLITTPIYYCNATPHIGHIYSSIVADTLSRYQRQLARRPTRLSTGTDEHGSKVMEAAQKNSPAGSVKEYTDTISSYFKVAMDDFNVGYDTFVRTTDDRHKRTVEWMWKRIVDRGCIYKGSHTGWYCRSEEAFIPASQVTTDENGNHVIEDRPWQGVEYMSEENYKFRLSLFRDPLLQWMDGELSDKELYNKTNKLLQETPGCVSHDAISKHSQETTGVLKAWDRSNKEKSEGKRSPIVPYSRSNELRAILEDGLEDLSVSRLSSKVSWGIRVPTDPQHTVYVWLDALTNYLTVSNMYENFGANPNHEMSDTYTSSTTQTWWPAETHVIGKDILKFHCVYWPAFLLAAGLPLPKRVLIHGHWLSEGRKMSKSLGNIVDLNDLKAQYPIDALRYFLLREGRFDQDGNIHHENLERRAIGDCADTLGNLASRALGRVLLPNQQVPIPGHLEDDEKQIIELVNSLQITVGEHYENADVSSALEQIMDAAGEVNRYFANSEPWNLRPGKPNENENRLRTVLWLTLESLRVFGILLQPAMPSSMARLLDYLGVEQGEEYRSLATAYLDIEGFKPRPVGSAVGFDEKLVLFEKKR